MRSTPTRLPAGEKSVVVRLGSHGSAFLPGLQSQTTFASAPAGATQSTASASSAATSGNRSLTGRMLRHA